MVAAAKTAGETGAKYCMNLSAPFLMEVPPLFGPYCMTPRALG